MALISKEDLLTKFETGALLFQPEVKRIIKIQPEVDAEPVVRCKDCKYADGYCHCSYTTWWNSPDDFCSRGKRRADADE